MTHHQQLRQEIERILTKDNEQFIDVSFEEWEEQRKDWIRSLLALIESEKRKAVDEFQDRLDEKEFTLGNDTTTPAIVYQWMQEVTDEMFPTHQ